MSRSKIASLLVPIAVVVSLRFVPACVTEQCQKGTTASDDIDLSPRPEGTGGFGSVDAGSDSAPFKGDVLELADGESCQAMCAATQEGFGALSVKSCRFTVTEVGKPVAHCEFECRRSP